MPLVAGVIWAHSAPVKTLLPARFAASELIHLMSDEASSKLQREWSADSKWPDKSKRAPWPSHSDTDAQPLRGVFIGSGVTCPQFQLQSGEQISLSGDVSAMQIGKTYELRGRFARLSKCMQGRELRVHRIDPIAN